MIQYITLIKLMVAQPVQSSFPFTEHERLLPCSQEPAPGLYFEPYPQNLFFKIDFNIILLSMPHF
jgi:hypothetical protein